MKFKVSNDTIKKVLEGERDTRPLIERVGHPVTFTDADGRHHMLTQHQPGIFVERLTPGMLALRDEGLVRIEQVDDITTVLKAHTLKKPAKVESEQRKAKAVAMGAEEVKDSEGVNPDGEPNFVVTAKSSRRKRG